MYKAIYFPRYFGDGNRYGYPEIIYFNEYTKRELFGSSDLKDIENGRIGTYLISRCIPYSDSSWEECKLHIQKRNEIKVEYDSFIKMARKEKDIICENERKNG